MNDKQTLTLLNAVTNIVSQDDRQFLLLVDGFGDFGKRTHVIASLKDSVDLEKKFIMLLQSATYNVDIDFETLLNRINAEAEKRGLIKKEG